MPLPPIRPPGRRSEPLDIDLASKAVETVKAAAAYFVAGPPIVHRHPHGVHVDIPLIYQGYALDRIHFDACRMVFLPKGYPGECMCEPGPEEVREAAEKLLTEIRVIDAAEYREPEEAWAVPVAWRSLVIAHIRVSRDGTHIVPDYGLTREVRMLLGE